MFDIFFIVFILSFSLLCFLEIIVFNEEILLALCFFSFIFFCLNTLSDSVFESFDSRAKKFESDLMMSFSSLKNLTSQNFTTFSKKIGLLESTKITYMTTKVFLENSKQNVKAETAITFTNICFSNLNELLLFNDKLLTGFKKYCVTNLLYPLIFQATKPGALLSFVSKNTKIKRLSSKALNLKVLS